MIGLSDRLFRPVKITNLTKSIYIVNPFHKLYHIHEKDALESISISSFLLAIFIISHMTYEHYSYTVMIVNCEFFLSSQSD